ncbi:MAG: M17 family peptidase N-terminal domain-containing protein, partial [Syntrophaceae bacterium]|nr:M17 family peptidase N-terminal domain-containing protein [Syntrophaceae bacterium]
MNITVTSGSLAEFPGEVLIAGHFQDNTAPEGAARLLDEHCGGMIGELIQRGDVTGKLYSCSVIYTRGVIPVRRILIAGLGKKDEFTLEKLRGVFSKAAREIRDLNIPQAAVSLDFGGMEFPRGDMAHAAVEGALLGLYRFTPYKTGEEDTKGEITEFTIVENRSEILEEIRNGARTAAIISRAVYCARDLVSTPSNDMTPTILADRAAAIAAETRLTCDVMDEAAMEKMGMRALLGVARGSAEEARLIIL